MRRWLLRILLPNGIIPIGSVKVQSIEDGWATVIYAGVEYVLGKGDRLDLFTSRERIAQILDR